MAWSYEARAGIWWVIIVLALMVLAMWLMPIVGNTAPLFIPTVGYALFFAWTVRLQR